MITRFDHVVIGVRNIEDAMESFSDLGFDVVEGGRHPLLGTRNAIVRFGLDYLELLGVENQLQAQKSGTFGAELVDFLVKGSGLVGFVLASNHLEHEAERMQKKEIEYSGPFAMDRERPDGTSIGWRLVVPGLSPWRKPWPFLIEWETEDKERLKLEPAGTHSNECEKVLGIDLLVGDLALARLFYEDGLGLQASSRIGAKEIAKSSSVVYEIGNFSLNVKLPSNEEEELEFERLGPGPFRLLLGPKSLSDSFRYNGKDESLSLLEFDIITALGTRIALVID